MGSQLVRTIAAAALTITAMAALLSQCRKPRWWPGRLFLWIMNVRHADVTRWGLNHVAIEKHFAILDVGCGGGRTIQRLADFASAGTVCGVDYSATSVAAARHLNAAGITAGRISIQQASVSRLPFPNDTFDLVSAIETHYYWPQPADDVREIARVLRPGGRFVLIAETYKDERFGRLLAIPMTMLRARYLTSSEHRALLTAAGFVDVSLDEDCGRGWMCALGRKPTAAAAEPVLQPTAAGAIISHTG